MGFTYGKTELIQELQELFARHNVRSVEVKEPGTLFLVEADGSLSIGVRAAITSFEEKPGAKGSRFKVIQGKKKT
ncbi:hypothetical protein JF544_01210 [Halobacillus kuroshimensis]|uniref:Uncharacterized protein n=1 Tax=Halobacillus kuroshimensis TaxID=302481 RepID=A0ABS3DR78_9BACI|nr:MULTISPECIES: hypothetical protein [Halobacillus]MBN8233839.1 hypothetical protein [Halobacillus kuroshimensis]